MPRHHDTDPTFDDVPIDRRNFLRLSAAVGGALALPGSATASLDSQKFEDEYQYVLNHTPEDYEVPTLIAFSDAAGFEALSALVDDAITTEEPKPAAYAELTAAQAEQASEIPTAETFDHSPGANPFWKLGYYPFGVFPDPYRSTDYISFEENVAGLEHLESEHPDRLNVFPIGKSPGHDNHLSDRVDPKDVWVAEVTNDVHDEETFEEKEKVYACLSMHGNEAAAREAGSRFIEDLLEGRETDTEVLLDDVVLLFVYANPDGWVARKPQYSTAPMYERGNAQVGDTNRQYPIAGWIDPGHYPAEPRGTNAESDQDGIDSDVPSEYLENVPDALAIVEHFRTYENLRYGADYHGMSVSDDFVLGLIAQNQFEHRELHELYEMNRVIGENLGEEHDPEPYSEESYDYSTVWDTLGYTDSGFNGDWLAHPKHVGGLGLTSMNFEMTLDNIVGQHFYSPHLIEAQVVGYKEGFRTLAAYGVENSDTPNTEDQFDADVETGGNSTAFVTTDALTRSSDQLEFRSDYDGYPDEAPDDGDADTRVNHTTTTASLEEAYGSVTVTVPENTHSLSVRTEPDAAPVAADLVDPDGEIVRTVDPTGVQPAWVVREPAAGEWTIELGAVSQVAESVDLEVDPSETVEVRATTLQTEDGTAAPDPEPATGYDQFDYKVSPLVYFDKDFLDRDDPLRVNEAATDYDDITDAPVDGVSLEQVRDGEHLAYDNLVVVHDDGLDDEAYVTALDAFVEAGGNLVLTDTGVRLLAEMEADFVSDIDGDNIVNEEFYVAHLGDKEDDHPLLDGVRPIQNQLYSTVPLGYSLAYEAPATLVDEEAFEDAGGDPAAVNDGNVSAGSLVSAEFEGTTRDIVDAEEGSIHVICGLLPPAYQKNLHPFGVLDYAVTFLGHTVLTNALGYVQRRFAGGETISTFGGNSEFEAGDSGGDAEEVDAGGNRDAGGTVQIGGRFVTNEVRLDHDAEVPLPVRDIVPYEYDVVETGETVVDVEPRRDDGVKIVTVGSDADPGETLEFSYLVRTPESVGTQRRSGVHDIGPAQVRDPESGEWVDVDDTDATHVVVALEPLQEA